MLCVSGMYMYRYGHTAINSALPWYGIKLLMLSACCVAVLSCRTDSVVGRVNTCTCSWT